MFISVSRHHVQRASVACRSGRSNHHRLSGRPGISHPSATSHWLAILHLTSNVRRTSGPTNSRSHRIPVTAMADFNWRTINIDALDPESAYNFDLSTLTPTVQPTSTQDVQTLNGQIRQLLRGGNAEGALRGGLANVPYGADEQGKVCISPPVLTFAEERVGCG